MLDTSGGLVSFDAFRKHTLDVLKAKDKDKLAQSFILEQWISEAVSARYSFSIPSMQSISDVPFLLLQSFEFDPSQAFDDGICEESHAVSTPPVAMSARAEPELVDKSQVEFGSWGAPTAGRLQEVADLRGGLLSVPRAPAPSEAPSSWLSKADVASDRPVVQVIIVDYDTHVPR